MTIKRMPNDWYRKYHDNAEPHYLYRCYDADGVLLYIGCSVDVKARMVTHRAGRKQRASLLLQRFMDHHDVDADTYKGRLAGQAAEAAAIRAELPVFNVNGTGRGHWASNYIADYLIDRDEIALAVELACACWRETLERGMCDPWCHSHLADEVLPVWDSEGDWCEGMADAA